MPVPRSCWLAALTLLPPLAAQSPIYRAARQPIADPAVAALPGGVMLSIPGLLTDFTLAGGGQFVELPNGEARLTGRVLSDASIYSAFLVDVLFTGRVAPGHPSYPPAGAPDLQLLPSAYAPAGPVDPNQFVYFTAATGTLTGVRNLDGAVLAITLATPPAQLGPGANNRNTALGLAANLQVAIVQQNYFGTVGPLSTASLWLDLPPHRTLDTTHPQVDSTRSALPFGRAMVLPGVADDYVFVPAGDFTEYADGHAELAGTLARPSQLDDRWDVALQFQNRVDPGQPGCPPAGSPVLQMLPGAYVQNGGTMDPGHWRYYRTATGTLTGQGLNAGGSIALAETVATQVGGAANQTNTYCGFYGAFAPTLLAQPAGRTIAIAGPVELFGLTATFPVLPFPVLTPPAVPYTLDTLTDQGVVIEGDNLAWTDYVGVDWDLVGGRSAAQWFGGWFAVLDNQHLELHPRPGAVPGVHQLSIFNPAVRSNTQPITLTAPAAPRLISEAAVPAWTVQHLLVHSGPLTGPGLSAIALSDSLLPTTFPGLANLGIGNGGNDLFVFPGTFPHDPLTGIARCDLFVPAGFATLLHFQAVVLDLGNLVLPLPATNVWSVAYP
ncbi:MAG: hypothetical protein FJ265_12635 [Planctomycetes bacterium]|nr:hypothetical protein [Planctomycetota bacterium]